MPKAVKVMIVDDVQVREAHGAAEAALRKQGHDVAHIAPSELRPGALPGVDILIIGMNCRCPREVLQSAPQLRAVVTPVIGTDPIDVAAATELGIIVGHGATPENSESMAEATILLILALLYDLRRTEAILRDNLPRPAGQYAHMLRGRTLGLIGLGRIGNAVAARLQGWDVEVLAHTRSGGRAGVPPWVKMVPLDELLAASDIVSVHLGLNDSTRNLLDARRLSLLKPTAMLINTARGGIVDEDALCAMVREGRLWKVGLDTFATEPLPADSPLRDLPNTILTPHRLGHTIEGGESLNTTIVENLARLLRGEAPLYTRNPEVLPAWTSRWGKQ